METIFHESTIKGLSPEKIMGRIWRPWYRLKNRLRRAMDKAVRRKYKRRNSPHVYRVELR